MIPPANPSPAGSSEWLYNEIMRFIEPDLLLNVIPVLSAKYQNETQQQKAERTKRYDEAFAMFDMVYAHIGDVCHAQMQQARKQAYAEENQERRREMQTVETEFDALLSNPV